MKRKLNLKKQLACLYTCNFFSGLRITDAVWVALLAARGFSLLEIGIAESVFHVVSLFCEVPSGMFADMLGRKKTLVFGGAIIVIYNVMMAFAPNMFFVCLAMGLNALSNTMFSGTDTALMYDSLKQEGQTEKFIKISSNCNQINLFASAIGSLTSMLESVLHYVGFYLTSACFEGISALAKLFLVEPVVTEAQANRDKHSLKDIPNMFITLFKDSFNILRNCPLAVKLIASSAVISIPAYLTKMFIQERLIELGWSNAFLFVPMLMGSGAGIFGSYLAAKLSPKSLRKFYAICAIICGVGTLTVGMASAIVSIVGMMLVQGILEVWFIHEGQRLNDAIPSDQRATIISVDNMAYSLLMIPTSPIIGKIGDVFGNAGAGLAVLGAIVFLSGFVMLFRKRKAQ